MCSLIASLLLAALAAGAPQSSTQVMGRVVDAQTNDPLAGASIAFIPWDAASRQVSRTGPYRTETNGRGVFTIDLPPGRYRMQAQRVGFINDTGVVITIDGGTTMVPEIRLARGGAIAGRILGVNGRPLRGLSVFAVSPAANAMRGAIDALPIGRNAQTDDRGAYRLSGLPSGRYYVVAAPSSGSPFGQQSSSPVSSVDTYFPGVTEMSAASAVEVTAGNTTTAIDFQMQQAAMVAVSGIVVDDADRPVAGAMVYFNDRRALPLYSPTARTERDGTFRIAVRAGTYTVVAGAPSAASVGVATGPGFGIAITVEDRPIFGLRVVAQRR